MTSRVLVRHVALAIILFCGPAVWADSMPQPPCGQVPFPAYADLDKPPVVTVWDRTAEGRDWMPPLCIGWTAPGFSTLVVTTARFRADSGAEGLLQRIGAVSQLTRIRYWSTTHKRWQTLIADAFAMRGPTGEQRRADFSLQEMTQGAILHFQQTDNLSGKATYRLHVISVSADRLVFETENISIIRWHLVPLFHPGEIQSIYYLDRESPGVWRYYNITRTGKNANTLTSGHDTSSINRAVAFFRHWVGIPTDQEPPAAK